MKHLIVVDPGKYALKSIAVIQDRHLSVSFRSKMLENTMDIDVHGKSYGVIYEGKKYIIGEQGEEQNFDVSKTNLLHKLLTYVAITELIPNNSVIQLVLTCPVSIYKNKTLKDEYRNYILNDGGFDINVNNKAYHYEFENILIMPEDYGVVYMYPDYFRKKRTALIGVGGLNMNLEIINDLVPEISSMFTANHGGYELETNIINEFNSQFGVNIDYKNIPYIIKDGGLKIKGEIIPESIEILDNVIKKFITKIIQEIKQNGHNLDMLEVVFVGGTSLFIKVQIKEMIPHATIIDDAQWVAVEGSLKVGEIKYGKTTNITC
jgi:plasmid segregation protein ParM